MQIINDSLAKAYISVSSVTNSKIPWQFHDIPVKTEFPDITWFSRKWESCLSYKSDSDSLLLDQKSVLCGWHCSIA